MPLPVLFICNSDSRFYDQSGDLVASGTVLVTLTESFTVQDDTTSTRYTILPFQASVLISGGVVSSQISLVPNTGFSQFPSATHYAVQITTSLSVLQTRTTSWQTGQTGLIDYGLVSRA